MSVEQIIPLLSKRTDQQKEFRQRTLQHKKRIDKVFSEEEEEEEEGNDYDTWKEEFERLHYKILYPEPLFCHESDDDLFALSKTSFRESNLELGGHHLKNWFKDCNKRLYKKVDFYPPPLICPPEHHNTYKGFKFNSYEPEVMTDDTHWVLFKELLESLCNYDTISSDFLLKFVAHIVQEPGTKPGIALVILGLQGLGKSKFMDQIAKLIGHSYMFVTNDPQNALYGKFNGGTENKLVCEIDEAKSLDNIKNMGKIKHMITQKKMDIEKKGKSRIVINSFVRLCFTTNSKRPMQVEGSDRRIFAVTPSLKHKQDFEFFKQFDCCTDDQLWYTFQKLKEVKNVVGFNFERSLPTTDIKNSLKSMSVPYKYVWLNELIDDAIENKVDNIKFSHKDRFELYNKFFDSKGIKEKENEIRVGRFFYQDLGSDAGIVKSKSNGTDYCNINVDECKEHLITIGLRKKRLINDWAKRKVTFRELDSDDEE
jgi:hypothetical protein